MNNLNLNIDFSIKETCSAAAKLHADLSTHDARFASLWPISTDLVSSLPRKGNQQIKLIVPPPLVNLELTSSIFLYPQPFRFSCLASAYLFARCKIDKRYRSSLDPRCETPPWGYLCLVVVFPRFNRKKKYKYPRSEPL